VKEQERYDSHEQEAASDLKFRRLRFFVHFIISVLLFPVESVQKMLIGEVAGGRKAEWLRLGTLVRAVQSPSLWVSGTMRRM